MTAAVALRRLRRDQAVRSIDADRLRLATLGMRLDVAGRGVLTRELSSRIRTEPRFVPALRGLMRLSLGPAG